MKSFLALLSLVVFLTANTNFKRQKNASIPDLVKIEGGSFMMGQEDGESDEQPVHRVILKDFLIGKYEITVAQYAQFCKATEREMPDAPDWGWKDDHPIINTSWYDANAYIEWLNEKTNKNYRLPTEAEFEYVIRNGGENGRYPWGEGLPINENISDIASLSAGISKRFWTGYNDGQAITSPVGHYPPNKVGVFDINGNAWEWCGDWYATYQKKTVSDPPGPVSGTHKVGRGGSYNADPWHVRSASRSYVTPDFTGPGFRVAMDVTEE